MAITELNVAIKIDGLEYLKELVELVGRLNEKQIKISVSASPPKEN